MKKHISISRGTGHHLYLTVLCLLAIFSAFFFLVNPVQAIPVIFPASLPNGQVGSPYTTTLVVASTVGAYSWAVTGGALPTNLALNTTSGVISGTPTAPGTYTFMVTVTDTTGPSPAQGFFITITQPPLRFLTSSIPSAKVGESYTATIGVSGGTTPYNWSLSSGSLPSGLTIGAANGYVSGIPDKGTNGSYSFMVQVTDSSAVPLTGQQSYTITVEKGGYDAVITIGSGLKAGQTKVYTAGGTIATLRGGESTTLSLDLGITRGISVDSTVVNPTDENIRYKVEETAITVSESSPNANFTYHTEFYITIKVDPTKVGSLSGSGWYKEDYPLRTSAKDQVNDPNTQGIQYRFTYWQLPTGESISNKDLNLTVTAAGTCTAYYDTYYLLTITSPYGVAMDNSQWYKAGSNAKWSTENTQVKMQGFLGIFGGKLNAVNSSGTTLMDGPKAVTIEWEPDYTMPFIMIPLTIVLLILGIYGLVLLVRSQQPKPAPAPPPYYPYMPPPQPQQPIQPPQTTVVMIGGDKPKLGPGTTREQLMEKFGELLQKYEEEIKTTTPQLPGAQTVGIDKQLPAAGAIPAAAEAAASPGEETATCNFTSKRALRVVVSNWRQVETRTAKLPADKKKAEKAEETPGIAITWARDVFQEWEILSCWLPRGHKEPHEGSVEIVYSRMNTVNEEKIYAPGQELEPPAPHYTDGMPQVDISAREVIAPEKLPTETAS
jgi:Putative Ig domain